MYKITLHGRSGFSIENVCHYFWLPLFYISQLTVHCTLYILSADIFKYQHQLNAEAVMQWVSPATGRLGGRIPTATHVSR